MRVMLRGILSGASVSTVVSFLGFALMPYALQAAGTSADHELGGAVDGGPGRRLVGRRLGEAGDRALRKFSLVLAEERPDPAKEKKSSTKKTSKSRTAAASFFVVKVGEDIKILSKSELDEAKKKAVADYKQALAEYNAAKREATKNKKRFTGEKPTRTRVTVLKSGLASREKAEEERSKLKEGRKGRTERSSRASFAVVQVAEDVKVVTAAELGELKKQIDDEYQQSLEKFREDQKEAAQRGQRFSGKPPVRKALKVLASRVSSREKAEALKQKALSGGKKDGKKKANKAKGKD